MSGNRGIELEVIWFDDDMVELQVRAGNGLFAGSTETYVGHESCAELAACIAGFPTSIEDHREFELGAFDPACASGGARVVFRCRDRWGHAEVEVHLRAEHFQDTGRPDEATFSVRVEAAAIDDFVADLRAMSVVAGAMARLRQAP